MTTERKPLKELLFPYKPWYKNLVPRGTIPSWFFLLFILFSAWAYHHDTATYREVYEHPCDYCTACQEAALPTRTPLLEYNDTILPDIDFAGNIIG